MKNRILIIDDEVAIASSIKFFLGNAGYQVTTAVAEEDIIGVYRDYKPNLIITDYLMPNYDGGSLIRDIRKINQVMPIIIITGYNRSVALENYELIKIITKPFLLENLLVEVRNFIN